MGYLKIPNLYKAKGIDQFKDLYALEKVHGTSAHIRFDSTGAVYFYSGGANPEAFRALFDAEALEATYREVFGTGATVTLFGEAYGGKLQRMSHTYGPDLRFIVFDVQVDKVWLGVPDADSVTLRFGLEFVPYRLIPGTQEAVDAERDRPSEVAIRRGLGCDRPREGVVLRPPSEYLRASGTRVIAKHKGEKFCETASKREAKPDQRTVLDEASAVAEEWVTTERLQHVLDKMSEALVAEAPACGPIADRVIFDVGDTPEVIATMVEDVLVEGAGEFPDTKPIRKAISSRTARLFKAWLADNPPTMFS